MIALKEFIKKQKKFVIDKELCSKLQITETYDGYLKKISNFFAVSYSEGVPQNYIFNVVF